MTLAVSRQRLVRVKDAVIVHTCPEFERMFGYDIGELNGKPATIISYETDDKSSAKEAKEIVEQVSKFGEAICEIRAVKKDGTAFWCRAHTTQLDHPEFGLVWVQIHKDIELRKKTEESDSKREVSRIQSAERSRISLEIHDELGQSLTVLKMDLFDLKMEIPLESSLNKKILKMDSSINLLLQQVQKIAHQLRPEALTHDGLEAGVESLVSELRSRIGILVNLDISLEGHEINQDVSTAIFRILQEALTNTIRHSQSKKVDVSLKKTKSGIALTVRDYDESKVFSYISPSNRLGVVGMKERATSLGGSFSIENRGGTIVCADFPQIKAGDIKNIVVADDHFIVRQGVKRIISLNTEYTVVGEAASFQDLRTVLSAQRVDALILDLSMPGGGGLDALREIKKNNPKTKILILSLYPEEQFGLRAFRAGVSGYLSKECASEQLLKALRAVLTGKRYFTQVTEDLIFSELETNNAQSELRHCLLSDREIHVFTMLGQGRTVTVISRDISLSIKTVSTYRRRVLKKMNMTTNAQIVRYAISHCLIPTISNTLGLVLPIPGVEIS